MENIKKTAIRMNFFKILGEANKYAFLRLGSRAQPPLALLLIFPNPHSKPQ